VTRDKPPPISLFCSFPFNCSCNISHVLLSILFWYSQIAKASRLSFWSKSKVDQVKVSAPMTYSMKSENKFEGASNFRAWKTRIDLILAKNKVLDIVKGKIMEPQSKAGKEKEPQNIAAMEKFKDNDINTMSIIVNSLKYHLIPYISHLDSSKKMYDSLTNLFSIRNIGQVMSLKNELRDTKMTKDDTIASYVVRISQLRDQLQAIEEVIPEKEVVNIALNGLSRSWDAFAASMNTRKEFPTLEELWTCCAQEETRINSKRKYHKEGDAQAYATKFKKHEGNKIFGSRKKFNHKRDMSKVQCFGCNEYGHYKRDFPKLAKKRKERHHASVVNDEEPSKKVKHEETDFFYYSSLTRSFEDDMWLIDSGASRHMTSDRENLSSMMEKETSHKVELGDNNSYAVKGLGKASIKMELGNNVHLNNVLYVHGLKKNSVSISCLEDKGDRITFVNGKFLVWYKDSKIEDARVIGIREGRLYKLLGQNTQSHVHDEIPPSDLWHRRYAHLHYQALQSLKQMVVGIPKLQSMHEGVCRGYALGKNIKKPFPSSENRSKEILDLIHSDVCGPMPVKSLGGSLYYVMFIDDFSRNTWMYLINTKDEVFGKFQEFKAEVENLKNKKIKTLKTDNGGEYTSKELVSFCKQVGIMRELIVPHNPQKIGVDERKNRTIEESVKAMMNDQNLSIFMWEEAAMTVFYVQNRIPHRILKNMTPKKAFSGKKPSVEHLGIFGCHVYIHVPKDKRKKLKPSGKKGIFVGYSEPSKAYRIYVPGQQKFEISIDVTFDERIAFNKSIEDSIDSNE
jgi:hypothetical protein